MFSPTDPLRHRERQGKALRNRNLPKKKIPVRPPVVLQSASPEPVVQEVRRKKRWLPFLLILLLVLLQAGLIAVIVRVIRTPEEMPDRVVLEVRYQIPGRDDITESVYYGDSVTLHEPVPKKGYTFFGWMDADGKTETRTSFPVYRDTVYTARYMPTFETKKHISYLSTDGEAVVNVDGPVTIREFVNILYLLLNRDLPGTGRFVDVPEEDDCFEAAASLKDLGVLTGARLHPDANLTCGELLEILCRFFPESEETFEFQDLESDSPYYPYFCTAAANGWIPSGKLVRANALEDISRGRFARIMNHVLQRDARHELKQEDVGTILDVPPSNDYYNDVVEAVIPHRYKIRNGSEVWTASEALPVHEPGFFFTGYRLHYIDEDGNPAVNATVNGLTYNRNGEVTSGDEELDRALIAILKETIDPDKMDREEMLRAVYDYVVDNYTYRYGSMLPFGAEGWEIREAKRMLEFDSGNCYCFAALFYELARFVGYDAKIYSGRVYGEQYEYRGYDQDLIYAPMGYTPHGWVEIEFDGEPYIFDTEFEYRSWGLRDMYMGGEKVRAQYGYMKAEDPK